MADTNCDQISSLGGSASAGLGGASQQARSAEVAGRVRVMRFSKTIPASGAGSAQNDRIKLPPIEPTARMLAIRVYNPGLGANATISIGKIDTNDSNNDDDAHYLAAAAAANPGILDANLNMTEQVGADSTGASTDTGNGPAGGAIGGGFGNGPIYPTLKLGGAAPAAGSFITGYYLYSPGA